MTLILPQMHYPNLPRDEFTPTEIEQMCYFSSLKHHLYNDIKSSFHRTKPDYLDFSSLVINKQIKRFMPRQKGLKTTLFIYFMPRQKVSKNPCFYILCQEKRYKSNPVYIFYATTKGLKASLFIYFMLRQKV